MAGFAAHNRRFHPEIAGTGATTVPARMPNQPAALPITALPGLIGQTQPQVLAKMLPWESLIPFVPMRFIVGTVVAKGNRNEVITALENLRTTMNEAIKEYEFAGSLIDNLRAPGQIPESSRAAHAGGPSYQPFTGERITDPHRTIQS
jgi:hypothetical protein